MEASDFSRKDHGEHRKGNAGHTEGQCCTNPPTPMWVSTASPAAKQKEMTKKGKADPSQFKEAKLHSYVRGRNS